ncbi:MAG TPA: sigma-70 family RNA polymerase sigma factor [Bryobacteraceae bacterium]|nr:sigma-70 family RNA polymerase sigma factor [Bryobacteraceae bacterium]
MSTAVNFQLARAESEAEQQLNRLLEANGPALVRLAASYTNTASDRDDLVQDIAIALWKALRKFRGECSERTFLFRVAHNRAIDYLRQRGAVTASLDDDTPVRDARPNPEAGLAQEQQGERLRQAIRRLPLAYRQVITLTLEEMSYSEIAEVLGVTETNVGVRLNRARQLLRELLEKRK